MAAGACFTRVISRRSADSLSQSTLADFPRSCQKSRIRNNLPRSVRLVGSLLNLLASLVASFLAIGITLLSADNFEKWLFTIEVMGDSLYEVRCFFNLWHG